MVRPAVRTAAGSEQFRHWLAASAQSATRSTGWRQAVASSAPRAATIWPTTVGSKAGACSQPIRSRHSNALLMKSSECPASANARSVSAANRASASTAARETSRNRREQGSLGRLAVAHIRPTLQPGLERRLAPAGSQAAHVPAAAPRRRSPPARDARRGTGLGICGVGRSRGARSGLPSCFAVRPQPSC